MTLPPPRVQEVLATLRDLTPEQARVLLKQVVATLDAAELLALRSWLPPATVLFLPGCVGALPGPNEVATVMNQAPMPWELLGPPAPPPPPPPAPAPAPSIGVETGKLIRAALPSPSRSRTRALAAGALCALALAGTVAWSHGAGEEEAPAGAPLVPMPRVTEYAPMSAPKLVKLKKVIARKTARKATATVARSPANDWASPFERRE